MRFKARKRMFNILGLFSILIFLIFMVPYTYSKYESEGNSNVETSVAYYLLKTGYMTGNIKLTDLVPSDDPYVYTFTIANYNGSNRLETNLEYDLMIKTTTNLPLTFELYMNEDYNNPASTNIITSQDVVADEYGTYFREIKVAKEYFGFITNEINSYTLLIYFPKSYVSSQYQDLIDSIDLIIDSKQILE